MKIVKSYSCYGGGKIVIDDEVINIIKKFCNDVELRVMKIGCWGTLTPVVYVEGGKMIIHNVIYGYKSNKHNQGLKVDIEIDDELKIGYIRQEGQGEMYSHGRKYGILFGVDDGHAFSVRVSSSCDSIESALDFLKPAKVKKAEKKGLKVYRQGEWFFIEAKKEKNMVSRGQHIVEKTEQGFVIKHPQHKELYLQGYNWEMVHNKQQSGYRGKRFSLD
jgi:hypothetical protein